MNLKDLTINENLIDFDEEHDKKQEKCKYLFYQIKKCKKDKEFWDLWAEYQTITLIPHDFNLISDSIDF